MTKYAFLTKEILQQDYDDLGTLSAIGRKYGIPTNSVKTRAYKFGVKMDPSGGKCRYTVNEDFFDQDSEECFYVAGFAAADGNVNYWNYSQALSIGLSSTDKDHLLKIKDIMGFTGNIYDYSYVNTDCKKMCHSSWMKIHCSKKIVADIGTKFNVLPRKTFTYEFPVGIINHDMVRHFIRGYFDGDGCFSIDKRNSAVCFELLGTQFFLETVRDILDRECDLQSENTVQKIKNIFRLRFGGRHQVSKIVTYLYGDSTIYLQRKFDKISHLIKR
jgi:hypothetical protein